MDVKNIGDYVQWYCEWCDSRNLVHRNVFVPGLGCGACHTGASDIDLPVAIPAG